MDIKDYLLSLVLAVVGAAILVFALWLFSLVSWAIVWAVLVFAMIPVGKAAIDLWHEESCYDLDDFWTALMEHKKEKKTSSITDDEDW